MKNLFLSLVLVMVSLVANSQKPTYFNTEFSEDSVLLSLDIPYLSIQRRNGFNDFGTIQVDRKKVLEFNKFFSNNEFVFTPTKDSPSIKFESFFKNYKFVSDKDKLFIACFYVTDFDVVGSSKIKINKSTDIYKSVEIIEYRDNLDNTYGTIVVLETQNNLKTFVW